jgi:adenylylsulfate kinase-like enzyme
MIIVLFGQPGSGKTTLAKELMKELPLAIHLDGDELREIFKDVDYSKDGRINNLNRASFIAVFMQSKGYDVILSLAYPYKESRDYLRIHGEDVNFIHLHYNSDRNKKHFQIKDFEVPGEEKCLRFDTSFLKIDQCISLIHLHLLSKRKDI